MLVRSFVRDKKKKKSVTLEITDTSTQVFIGFVALATTGWFAAIDISRGYLDDFNSIVWFGMFIKEIAIAMTSVTSKKEKSDDRSSDVSRPKHVLRNKTRRTSGSNASRRSNNKQSKRPQVS